jgi:hypothetical protein
MSIVERAFLPLNKRELEGVIDLPEPPPKPMPR